MNRRHPLALSAILALILACPPSPAAAVVYTTDGNVDPADPTTWNSTDTEAKIGNSADGTLTLTDGTIYALFAHVGCNNGVSGSATISGANSTWTNEHCLDIGESGSGTLTITNGGSVSDTTGNIGYGSGSTGKVTVEGANSTWANSRDLYVGTFGSGTLDVLGGGSVSNSYGGFFGGMYAGYIGYDLGSTGVVAVDGANSTWTNSSRLYVGDMGSGTLKITNGGSVSSSGAGSVNNFGGSIGHFSGTGEVTVDGANSMWANNGDLYVGDYGSGTMNVTNGGNVSNSHGSIGNQSGSTGTVNVDGTTSKWTNSGALYVGRSGSGALKITNGGSVSCSSAQIGASANGWSGSVSVVTVDGANSTLTNSGLLYVGHPGLGCTLSITRGGNVSNSIGYISFYSYSNSVVVVDGIGSTWTNSSDLYIGYGGKSTLNVTGGGAVTATSVSINSSSLLAIDVGHNSSLTVSGGTNTNIENSGTVRILAGAGAKVGTPYSPITADNWTGSGTYRPIGGTWDEDGHTFTASAVQKIEPGKPTNVVLSSFQRIIVNDVGPDGKPWSVGASFAPSSNTAVVTASAIDSGALALLDSALLASSPDENLSVLNAFEFSVTGVAISPSNPAYLSFDIGGGLSRNDLDIWHYAAGAWSEYDVSDLTYDNTYVSFTATSFSSYAVVAAVPEPGTLAMLLAAAVALAVYVRRKR